MTSVDVSPTPVIEATWSPVIEAVTTSAVHSTPVIKDVTLTITKAVTTSDVAPKPAPNQARKPWDEQEAFEAYLRDTVGGPDNKAALVSSPPILQRGPTKGSGDLVNVAVVVRTYGPLTEFKKQFLFNLTTQLQPRTEAHDSSKLAPSTCTTQTHYDVWVLYDSTEAIAKDRRRWKKWTRKPSVMSNNAAHKPTTTMQITSPIGFVEHNTSNLLEHFSDTTFIQREHKMVAWGFHELSILYFEV
jgi:hypothetical protein